MAKLEAIIAKYTKTNGAEITTDEDKTPEHKLAQWWMDFGITRKITKRNCMTFPSVWTKTEHGAKLSSIA